ncbi:hypothetical protein L2X67_17065 [Enterobacter ludwigii]|nr:hypothetical protein [Enterobacter ludwigii]
MNFEEAKQFLRQIERWPTADMHPNHVAYLHPLPEGWRWMSVGDDYSVLAILESVNGGVTDQIFTYNKVWANPVKFSPEAEDLIARLARGEPL